MTNKPQHAYKLWNYQSDFGDQHKILRLPKVQCFIHGSALQHILCKRLRDMLTCVWDLVDLSSFFGIGRVGKSSGGALRCLDPVLLGLGLLGLGGFANSICIPSSIAESLNDRRILQANFRSHSRNKILPIAGGICKCTKNRVDTEYI